MNRPKKIVMYLAFLLILIVAGCGSSEDVDGNASSASSADPERLLLGTSSQGGTYYVLGGGWANIMNENVPGVDISVEVTGGPNTNIQLIENEEMELGFVTSWLAGEAYEGVGWADKKYENFSALFPMYPSVLYITSLKENNIETISDFEGKHITIGAPGATSELAGRAVMDALEIEPREISSLPTNTATDNLKDGIADAGFAVTGIPGPFLIDLETTHDIQFVDLSEGELETVLEENPYWSTHVLPAGTYKDLEEDMTLIAFWNFAVGSNDLSEDLVYEIVKATFENQEQIVNVDQAAKDLLAENIVHSSIPFHPGAVKYYEEIGVEVPSHLMPTE